MIKLGTMMKICNHPILNGTNVVIRGLGRSMTSLGNCEIDETMLEEIPNLTNKLVKIAEDAFDSYISTGYISAERSNGRVVMYGSDNFREIKNKVMDSIITGDFTNFSEKEIMAMAKVIDYNHQKANTVTVYREVFEMEHFYVYLQFNMDFKVRDGVITNTLRKL